MHKAVRFTSFFERAFSANVCAKIFAMVIFLHFSFYLLAADNGASYESIGVCSNYINVTDPDNAGDTGQSMSWSHAIDTNMTWGEGGLPGTVHSYYYGINFDSMGAAFVALFHLLIMNNWHVSHEVMRHAATGNARRVCTLNIFCL
eukprot:SAG31_NODE_1577_length_7836_cov_3.212744_7_plen_146_part_00